MEKRYLAPIFTLAMATALVANLDDVALASSNEKSSSSSYSSTGVVTATVLNVRANANTSSNIIGKLSYNTKVNVLEINNGWYKINYNNSLGWISSDYVKLDNSNSTVQNSKFGTVIANSLNVRDGNSTSHNIIGSLQKGKEVEILETSKGWHKIKFNNSTAYVSADYISTPENRPNRGDEDTSTPAPSPNGTIGIVNSYGLNFRKGPSTSYEVISVIPYNGQVEIVGEDNGWYQVKYNNTLGFASKDHITISSGVITPPDNGNNTDESVDPNVTGKIAIVNVDTLNIRSGPGDNYEVIGKSRYGNKLPIISYSNGWYKVNFDTSSGYINGNCVTIVNENISTPPIVKETPLIESTYTEADIIAESEKYLGVPYVWGGFTPLGFDCSGLVQYVYKQLGITLERSTYYQVHQGKTVSRSELMPGDLIFFTGTPNDPNDISHVGIYKGNDLFIHSPNPGDYVRVSNLNSAYYDSRYYVSKRIITPSK